MTMIKLASAFWMITWLTTAQAALILDVDADGNLLGAKDVIVDGTLYDVHFLDGTCIELFSGCDENIDFTFNTRQSAELAAIALLNSVFTNTPLGNFDDKPALTNGCSASSVCQVKTMFRIFSVGDTTYADGWTANNREAGSTRAEDWFTGAFLPRGGTAGGAQTFAVWKSAASVSEVPTPSCMIMLMLALTGLLMSRKSKCV